MTAFDSKLTVDALIVRAASKAFSKVFKLNNLQVARVSGQKVSIIKGSEKLSTSQILSNEQKLAGGSFAADVPASQLEIHQVNHSVEALPIANQRSMMTLHFTQPEKEVVIDSDELHFNIETIGDKPVSYDVKLKTSQRVKLSISFDSSKVDEVTAVKFLSKLQTFLDDPDTMLL